MSDEDLAYFKDPKTLEEAVDHVMLKCDKDHNGKIDRKELKHAFKMLGKLMDFPKVTPEDIDKTLIAFDTNGDGVLDRGELTKLMELFLDCLVKSIQDNNK